MGEEIEYTWQHYNSPTFMLKISFHCGMPQPIHLRNRIKNLNIVYTNMRSYHAGKYATSKIP